MTTKLTTEQRAKIVEELAMVREKLRLGKARYLTIATEIKELRLAKDNLRGRIRNAEERIGTHSNQRPRCWEWLPDDPDVVEYERVHAALEAEREALCAELRGINSEQNTFEACQYEGPTGILVTLALAEGNLLAALERDADQRRGPWERGEINAVH
jgi:hypothetical protein